MFQAESTTHSIASAQRPQSTTGQTDLATFTRELRPMLATFRALLAEVDDLDQRPAIEAARLVAQFQHEVVAMDALIDQLTASARAQARLV